MLDELYQEVILDHNKSPRNYGVLDKYTCTSDIIDALAILIAPVPVEPEVGSLLFL